MQHDSSYPDYSVESSQILITHSAVIGWSERVVDRHHEGHNMRCYFEPWMGWVIHLSGTSIEMNTKWYCKMSALNFKHNIPVHAVKVKHPLAGEGGWCQEHACHQIPVISSLLKIDRCIKYGSRWTCMFCFQALSPEEREPFNAQAKREKQNRRYGPQPDKMDCTGQYISVSTVIHLCCLNNSRFSMNYIQLVLLNNMHNMINWTFQHAK